jgi:hypothetical protein
MGASFETVKKKNHHRLLGPVMDALNLGSFDD